MSNTFFSNTGINDFLNVYFNSGSNGFNAISLHTASPSTSGANEVSGGSYARQSSTWSAPSGSSMTGAQVTLNVPAATTIAYFGIWTLTSGGTYLGGGPLPANETYGSAGTYLLTPTLAGSG